jgi:hypothetical protein
LSSDQDSFEEEKDDEVLTESEELTLSEDENNNE